VIGPVTSDAGTPRSAVRRPWLPACLAASGLTLERVQSMSYLVVEEMVEDIITITVSPWPAADGHGRLRFGETDVAEVAVPAAELYRQLYQGWLARRPHIGDVFAARVDREVLDAATQDVWDGPLGRLLPEGAYDLSAEARKVAKLALYAARSDILEHAEAVANGLDAKAVRNERPARYRPHLERSDPEVTT
jgi:hypothetical protein